MQQEREKTSKTRDLVDHSPQPRFVLNVHSIHNYKSILAATPLDIRKPSSLDVDVVALRKRAAQLIRKEPTDDVDIARPTDTHELTSDSIPFDRTRGKTQAVPQHDINAAFTGSLSSQRKLELVTMAAVLGIPTTEKDSKQELTSKIRDHLDANPDIRNGAQFKQLTWRSANRSKTSSTVVPAPSFETPLGMAMTHQQLPSFVPSSSPFLQFGVPTIGFPAPSTSSHASSLHYAPLMTPTPYLFPPSHIPPVGGQYDWQGQSSLLIQPRPNTCDLAQPGSVANQDHHSGS